MTAPPAAYATVPIGAEDPAAGFRCGNHDLDDFFARHALANDADGIGRTYVLRRRRGDPTSDPAVLGFYTSSMAHAESAALSRALARKLPRYPVPVALIGRLAVDERAQGRRLGEKLLVDALRRIVDAANILGCVGVVVDAKDAKAEAFYAKYDFVTVAAASWPRRMFLPVETARAALRV